MTNDFNRKNLLDGIRTLRGRTRQGFVAIPDISDVDFQANTAEAFDFLAGYVAVLLDRVTELEERLDKSA